VSHTANWEPILTCQDNKKGWQMERVVRKFELMGRSARLAIAAAFNSFPASARARTILRSLALKGVEAATEAVAALRPNRVRNHSSTASRGVVAPPQA
jgi:hypothetical protein